MKRLMVAFVGAALVVTTIANGQSGPRQTGSTNAPYMMPSLADIMSLTQWRHLKLAYAGIVGNWPLAGFEWGQMQQSFSAAAQLYPVFKDIPLAQLIKEESEPALAEVGKAIEMKNMADAKQGFRKLTNACNNCHHRAGVGFIVIRVPTSSPFSNQLFPPKSNLDFHFCRNCVELRRLCLGDGGARQELAAGVVSPHAASVVAARTTVAPGAMTQLILKRASASRPSGEWNDDDFDVLAHGVVFGRMMRVHAAPVGSPWMWTLAFRHHEDRTPIHGYAATREAAMMAFAKSWRRGVSTREPRLGPAIAAAC